MRLGFGKLFPACSRVQRHGIIALCSLIVMVQAAILFYPEPPQKRETAEECAWLSLEPKIDSMKRAGLKPRKVYRFNPNFISDFKGYSLGMSTLEIDRLHAFRAQDKYVNSADEFQAVTGVSDSLLAAISAQFRFPDWVKNKRRFRNKGNFARNHSVKDAITQKDINSATADDLIAVYGIGAALSERILKQRELLGGFVDMQQMADVWGLSEDVIKNLNRHFKVFVRPTVKKINVNRASLKELGQFPYFRYPLSKSIVTYRSMNKKIESHSDLLSIPGFPVEKIGIIALYLEF